MVIFSWKHGQWLIFEPESIKKIVFLWSACVWLSRSCPTSPSDVLFILFLRVLNDKLPGDDACFSFIPPALCTWCIAFHIPFPIKTFRQISFPASQYLQDGFKIRLTRLPCLKAIPLSFSRLRNIETLSNLFRSVLLLSPGKWYFISPIMHADVATQAAGCQPLYQEDDDEARLHIKVGGWLSSLMCVCV